MSIRGKILAVAAIAAYGIFVFWSYKNFAKESRDMQGGLSAAYQDLWTLQDMVGSNINARVSLPAASVDELLKVRIVYMRMRLEANVQKLVASICYPLVIALILYFRMEIFRLRKKLAEKKDANAGGDNSGIQQ